MSDSFKFRWEEDIDKKIVRDNGWHFQRAIGESVKNPNVQNELNNSRGVFFNLRDGIFSTQNDQNSKLEPDRDLTSFKVRPDIGAVGVQSEEGFLDLSLNSKSRARFQNLDKLHTKEGASLKLSSKSREKFQQILSKRKLKGR